MIGPLRYMTKIKKSLLALSLLLAFTTTLSIVSPLFTPSAHAAPTKQECYDTLNGRNYGDLQDAELSNYADCFQNSNCSRGTPIVCSNPTDDSSNDNLEETKMAPVITLVCGAAPASNSPSAGAAAAYTACANSVRGVYTNAQNCINTAADEASNDTETITGITSCITPGLNQINGGKKVTASQVRTAVASGLDAAEKAANEAGTAKSKAECEANKTKKWENGKCVDDPDAVVVCGAGALGWLICPMIAVMQSAIQTIASLLDTFLQLQPLSQTGTGKTTYDLWKSVLNIANIILVIAFLFVIFSQATSIGLSNYGIKKILPRIIAAAILMNLSFFICQVLVDFSNILGGSAGQLVRAATDGATFSSAVTKQVSNLQQLAAAGVAIAIILFFFLIPVLLSFLAVFFTIAARFALIILLVLVAPLAFAAWVLPNTEKYFQKWWGLFFNLLMLYPIIMFVFAAAIIASRAVGAQS